MRAIHFTTRWPLHQITDNSFVVEVPEHAEGCAVINPEFATRLRLNDAELDAAEGAVLRAVAIMPE